MPVYFVQDSANGLVKIGWTRNLKLRLRTIKSEGKLSLLGTLETRFSTEARIHRLFVEHHVGGEWFNPAPEILAFAAAPCEPPKEIRTPRFKAPGTPGRPLIKEPRTVIKSIKFTEAEVAEIDAIRGDVPWSEWIRTVMLEELVVSNRSSEAARRKPRK